ncbi:UCH domain-containing protein [Cephalotus follicularis]|uniref:Ubiquitin carboxyl-terminal hydrolase n=1 Tax=Cephalotus follicularis TaxID=3775 RepID=A0A1Q3CSH4_CEPFO|nr:UCH domain-containing protein [Cephalotus follicularis]
MDIMRIQSDSDPVIGSSSSLIQRRIEFRPARRHFDGLINRSGDFKIETLNPEPALGNSGAVGGKISKGPGFFENGLDPEIQFGIFIRRIGAGLENLGNTCFLNSVLQCLTYTEPLVAYLQSGKHKNSCHVAGFCALCAIQTHVSRALQSTGRSLAPKDLVSNLRCISRNFRNARQEDAHEYMVNLLESMHKCCLPSGVPSESPSAYEKSLVHNIFGGRLRSQVKCMQCSYCSNKFDPFLDLSLEIFKADSLHKALLNFTAKELLDGGEKQYQCQRCKQKVRALKQLTVYKAPHVLTIHLKRFRAHDPGQKIVKKVSFGSTLDMRPFVSGSDEGDLKYTLYGVLVHYGWSTRSGHYSCFVRTSSGMWYSLDDNRVGQVSERTVLEQKAYMLFYVRDGRKIAPRKSVDIVQKENMKANVKENNICSIVNQYSKEMAQNVSMESRLKIADPFAVATQKDAVCVGSSKEIFAKEALFLPNSGQKMVKCSIPVKDAKVEPTSSSPLQKNSSGHSVPDSGLVEHVPSSARSGNRNGPTSSIKTDSEINDPKEKGSSETNLGVSVTISPSCSGHQNSAIDKLATSGTAQKVNVASKAEVARIASSGESADKTLGVLPGSGASMDSAQMVVKVDHVGGIPSDSVSVNSLCEKAGDSGPILVLESVELSTSSVIRNESTPIGAPDCTSHGRLKKKSHKCRITTMHIGLKISRSSLGLRKKKKLKRTKRRSLNSQSFSKEQLWGQECCPSHLGPSTSGKSGTTPLVSSNSQSKLASSSHPKNARNCNGDFLMNIIDGEFNKRLEQNGALLATEEKLHKSSDFILEANQRDARESDGSKHGKINRMMSKLIRGLEETVVARWDEMELPPQIGDSNTGEHISIGYVPDEWDEEYDRGKRKKLRLSKQTFGGPNPFQEIATKKSQLKKAKHDQSSSANQPFRI